MQVLVASYHSYLGHGSVSLSLQRESDNKTYSVWPMVGQQEFLEGIRTQLLSSVERAVTFTLQNYVPKCKDA